MPGLLVAMTTGGLAVLGAALVAGITVAGIRRSRVDPRLAPELRSAAQEIESQIDRGRSGLAR